VVAQARIAEGWDWERLGELDKSRGAFAEAHDLFAAAGGSNAERLLLTISPETFSTIRESMRRRTATYESAARSLSRNW